MRLVLLRCRMRPALGCRLWRAAFKAKGVQHVDVFVVDVGADALSVLTFMAWTVSVDLFVIWTPPAVSEAQRWDQREVAWLLAKRGFHPVVWSLPSWRPSAGGAFEGVFARRPKTAA
eukprot:Selendium_serpulae@DN6231_c2_g1_i2.p3